MLGHIWLVVLYKMCDEEDAISKSKQLKPEMRPQQARICITRFYNISVIWLI